MGVPAFFRWLSQKYPSIVQHCVEKHGQIMNDDGDRAPVDLTEPNPNGEEFDNLYLDMNGIIHPCTHPENKPAPKNEAEMFVAIFEYMDRLFALIRPRRLLYMAIDGVAPRAKMNQQRSRRFRAAKESHDKQLTIERLRAELLAKGASLPPPKSESEHFDSNCITPGTPFMDRLAIALRYYVYERLNSNPAWKNLQVILSDSNAPGEGEHKIMDFIRRQRQSPTHDPNTRHCLCGADADLIMLGLATHEPHFTIIREEFKPNQPRPCDLCGQFGHEMEDCVGTPRDEDDRSPPPPGADVEFIFIKLAVLRQYLEKELQMPNLPFEWDLERAIDDWVFMCFFVGNDFLPHLPSLEIREGAIDRLIELYKSTVTDADGWLTDSGHVHLDRVQTILTELGKVEDEIFKSRRESELSFRDRKRRQNGRGYGRPGSGERPQRASWTPPSSGLLAPVAIANQGGVARRNSGGPYRSSEQHSVSAQDVRNCRRGNMNVNMVERQLENMEAATLLKAMLKSTDIGAGSKRKSSSDDHEQPTKVIGLDPTPKGRLGGVDASAIIRKPATVGNNLPHASEAPLNVLFVLCIHYFKPRHFPRFCPCRHHQPDQMDEDEKVDQCDEVRLWEDGWRARYYQSKFGVDPADAPEFCLQVAHEYVIGLCWVLAYYYQGCASWNWYYPYHYAPFASDFVDVASVKLDFAEKRTKPFCPLEQLMGVFPAASRSHVPPAWQDLMTDPESPIIDFYPTDFKIDLNGKRYLWMGVALLPFVDEVRLLKALDSRRNLLTVEEKTRNLRRPELYFCHADTEMGKYLASLYEETGEQKINGGVDRQAVGELVSYGGEAPDHSSIINAALTEGLSGRIWPDYDCACLPGHRMRSGVPSLLPDISAVKQRAICAFFENPAYPFGHIFPARLLDSVSSAFCAFYPSGMG
ncbi:unnamed protein product [Schistocephalus solidus]|uniref:5'-3' exoribonuclease n=1 Tax=Schistocephalus solidus TaxID=70667 RepID=A0A183T6Q8_SCHSO|nr:unnamed protein product [Schistocephalus solidus]